MADDKHDGKGDKLLYCSFCGKSQHEVRKLIAGPSVFVCDECVELCNDIIREEVQDEADIGLARNKFPKPREIKQILDEYVIGQATDIDIHAREILRVRERLNGILVKHTGQELKRIEQDTERDNFMDGGEAVAYGLIDSVIDKRK